MKNLSLMNMLTNPPELVGREGGSQKKFYKEPMLIILCKSALFYFFSAAKLPGSLEIEYYYGLKLSSNTFHN